MLPDLGKEAVTNALLSHPGIQNGGVMTFPAIPIAFSGVPLQRPNVDLPQIAGPSGVAVHTFGALLAGLAPHPDQRAPHPDAAMLGADLVPETPPPDPDDLAQSVTTAGGSAPIEDAENTHLFQGFDGPEGAEAAASSAPDFSVALAPSTVNLAVPAQPQQPLPDAAVKDAAMPQNPQLGTVMRPVVGAAPVVEMPAMQVPGDGPGLAQPSMPAPASIIVGGIGWAPLTPVVMAPVLGDAQALGALVPMADADTTQPPPPPVAPAAGTSPHTAGQWPADVVTPQPGLPAAAMPSFATQAQGLAQPAPGPMAPAPLMAAAPAAVLGQGQSDQPDGAQILIAKSPDQADARRPPAPVATVPAYLARLPLDQAALPLPAPQHDAQHRPVLTPTQLPPPMAQESAPALPPNMAPAVAPDAQPAATAPRPGQTNAPAAQPMAVAQLVSAPAAPAPAAELGQMPQPITPQPAMPPLMPPLTPPHAAVPPPPAATPAPTSAAPTPALPDRQPVAMQALAPAQAVQAKGMPAPVAKQPLKQPSVSFPLPADGAAAAPPRLAELALPHAPTAEAPRSPADAQAVIRQIVAHGPQAGQGDLEITLRPEELGRLRLVVHEHAGQTSLFVTADRPETLDLLRRHTDLLVQEFRSQGFGALNVSVGGGAPGRGFGQGQHSDSAAAADTASGPAVPVQPNLPARLANAGQGMDLRL